MLGRKLITHCIILWTICPRLIVVGLRPNLPYLSANLVGTEVLSKYKKVNLEMAEQLYKNYSIFTSTLYASELIRAASTLYRAKKCPHYKSSPNTLSHRSEKYQVVNMAPDYLIGVT